MIYLCRKIVDLIFRISFHPDNDLNDLSDHVFRDLPLRRAVSAGRRRLRSIRILFFRRPFRRIFFLWRPFCRIRSFGRFAFRLILCLFPSSDRIKIYNLSVKDFQRVPA